MNPSQAIVKEPRLGISVEPRHRMLPDPYSAALHGDLLLRFTNSNEERLPKNLKDILKDQERRMEQPWKQNTYRPLVI